MLKDRMISQLHKLFNLPKFNYKNYQSNKKRSKRRYDFLIQLLGNVFHNLEIEIPYWKM